MSIYLRKAEVAERLRMHPSSVMRLVKQGILPPPIKLVVGGPCLFKWERIEAAVEARGKATKKQADARAR